MTPFDAVILGIVEGATEFLPVSSTGHLILANALLGNSATEFAKSFEIVIQLGAILAVVALYWRSFLNIELVKKLAVAFIPTGTIGFALYPLVKTYFLGSIPVVLSALFVGGIVLIIFEHFHSKHPEDELIEKTMSYRDAALIGLFQALAIIPGVSRSAATILGGLALGYSRIAIVEFSFLLAVPTLLAASGLDLAQNGLAFTNGQWVSLLIGFGVSFAVAVASIKWLLGYIRNHSFSTFGLYRIVLAVIFFILFIS
ncbi:MAG: undecaprenyl-diphosphate phosphatase [bacterium]|nr:undecaprenyl-diphosphate phosphatase [bacterium]